MTLASNYKVTEEVESPLKVISIFLALDPVQYLLLLFDASWEKDVSSYDSVLMTEVSGAKAEKVILAAGEGFVYSHKETNNRILKWGCRSWVHEIVEPVPESKVTESQDAVFPWPVQPDLGEKLGHL